MSAPPRVDLRAVAPPRPYIPKLPRLVRPPAPREARTDVVLRRVLVGVALAFIAAYVAVALARFRYPYDLEWMEGGVLDHVSRVMHGQSVYGAPSVGFTPFLYTPLYYYVSAAASWVLGLHLSTLRLVSIVSSLVAFAAIGRLVWIETRSRWASVVAVGIFAACFRLAGAWLDLARVDTLFLALLFVGLVVVRQATTRRAALLAALLLAAAYLTKQSALIPSAAVLPFLWRRGRDLAVVYAATLGAVLVGTTVIFDHLTGGWYSQYTVRLAGQHAVARGEYLGFFTHDLLRPLAVVVVLGALGVLAVRHGERGWFWVPVGGGLLLASYTARLHTGGYDNVLLPVYGAVAVLGAVGLDALRRPAWPRRRRIVSRVAVAATIVTLATLAYNPFDQVPPASAAAAGDHLVADLGRLRGPVYLPSQSWLLPEAHAGTTTAHAAALEDILRAHLRGSNRTLSVQLHSAVANHAFGSIVVDSPSAYSYLPRDIRHYYCPAQKLPRHDRIEPVTGTITAPATVWVPRSATAGCTDLNLRLHLRHW